MRRKISNDRFGIKNIYSNKTEEQIKQEQEKYLNNLASAIVLPEDEKKAIDIIDDSGLDKYTAEMDKE